MKNKINKIVEFYEKELQLLITQYSKTRLEVVRANTLLSKIVSLNYSQETFI